MFLFKGKSDLYTGMAVSSEPKQKGHTFLAGVNVAIHTIIANACVCCSVLQCVAVYCSVLQCMAVCCSVLQCIAVLAGVHVAMHTINTNACVCCSVLQCVAVRCSVDGSSCCDPHYQCKRLCV